MSTLGIIGSGKIGGAIARLAVAAGIEVVVANSRGPASLGELVDELGSLAAAGTVDEAVQAGELVVLSVPLAAVPTFAASLQGKIVLDTSNYYPSRDGRISELDTNALTTSQLVATWLGGARLVKVFNNVLAHHIPQLARPSGADDRTALPVAGDDPAATDAAIALLDQLGFDAVDVGSLAESWRFEPDTAAYTLLYVDPDLPLEQIMQSVGQPRSTADLRSALATSVRIPVGSRA